MEPGEALSAAAQLLLANSLLPLAFCLVPFAVIMGRRAFGRGPTKIAALCSRFTTLRRNEFCIFYATIVFQLLTATIQFVRKLERAGYEGESVVLRRMQVARG